MRGGKSLLLLFSISAFADTPPPGTVKSKTLDGSGTAITSTLIMGKQGLDVNVISSGGGPSAIDQGASGSDAWAVKFLSAQAVTGTFWQSTQPVSIATTVPVSGPLTDTQLRASAVPISAASLPLASGAATNSALTTINTTLGSPFQSGGSIGNAGFNVTGTLPAYASTPTFNLGTLNGASTAINQAAGNTYLSSIDTKIPALGQAIAAASTPVVLTASQLSTLTPLSSVSVSNFPATQPVSGTVVANIGTTNGLALDTSVNSLLKPASTLSAVTTLGSITSALPTGTNSIGQVTANAGTNLNTSALNLETTQTAFKSANHTDLLQINTTLGTPMQSSGGSVTVNAGTNLNTSALALSATQTDGTQKTKMIDGANATVGPVLSLSGTNYLPIVTASTGTTGAAVPARTLQIGGSDGTNLETIKVKTTGAVVVDRIGSASGQLVRNDYSSVNVTTAAYTQLIASTTNETNHLFIFDSSGQTLFLAVGAAASEVNKYYIVPGGNGLIDLNIPASSRVSIKAVSASATAGELSITLLQ